MLLVTKVFVLIGSLGSAVGTTYGTVVGLTQNSGEDAQSERVLEISQPTPWDVCFWRDSMGCTKGRPNADFEKYYSHYDLDRSMDYRTWANAIIQTEE
ncbi:hypothetical protein MHLP_03180 [Candidatus Mycoplasma haematolamae str. Purdue]|uniref:Uncharacterized protein n=1 Tax=Mycoplasma haematolamae (strain Purdue) TaxID=1212765 RepID=I7CG52_MYCHA|nr:hypothetical protein [Candidatus Mycoplasma haematolamae]AFO52216.1 hypothetical protein MHLP_03180 [Candidatus Mycoplasma haematolamae str. Purdue]